MELGGKTGDSAQKGRVETDNWFVLGLLNKGSGCHVWALHTAEVNNTVTDGVSRWNWGGSDGSDVQLFVATSPGTIQVVVRLKYLRTYIGFIVFGVDFRRIPLFGIDKLATDYKQALLEVTARCAASEGNQAGPYARKANTHMAFPHSQFAKRVSDTFAVG